MKKSLALVIAVILLMAMALPLSVSAVSFKPAEIADSFDVGVWPLPAGAYDPALDGQGILDGTTIYGLFTADYVVLDPPASLAGYTLAASPAALTPGSYFVLVGSSGFSYVLVLEADGADPVAPAPDPVAPAPDPVEPAPTAAEPAAPPPGVAPAGPGEDVAPIPNTVSPDTTGAVNIVFFTMIVNNEIVLAAQPIDLGDVDLTAGISTKTIADVIEAAHEQYYPGGAAAGFGAGIDATWNMYLISRVWGIDANPYMLLNNGTVGTANAEYVALFDNIAVSVSGDPDVLARAVTLALTDTGDSSTIAVKATEWVLDFNTFAYTSSPVKSGNIIDPVTGKSLALTDANGSATVTIPSSNLIALDGLAAIRADVKPGVVTKDYSLFGGYQGQKLLYICIFGVVVAVPLGVIVVRAQRRELKNRGVKFASSKIGK
jgi:hypothetical protein